MMKQKSETHHSNQSGAIFVLFAVTFLFLMAFSAIAIDMGTVYVQKERLQNAADAAALAGASQLGTDLTTDSITNTYIKQYVESNSDATVGSIDSAEYDSSSQKININAIYTTPNTNPLTKTVTVELRRRMPLYFMKYFGFATMPVVVSAQGQWQAKTTQSTSNPFSLFSNGPFKNNVIHAGSDEADSIHFWNIEDTIKGNISTNGTIQLTLDKKAHNKIQGNIIGNNQKGTVWTNSNYTLQGSNNSVSYADPYEIDYNKNTTDSSMVAIKKYIDGIISSASTGKAYDGSNEYTNSSTGGQIFYNDDASNLTFTMEKLFTVNNINMPMFTTGDGSSGYNIIIANGNINASTTISNSNFAP